MSSGYSKQSLRLARLHRTEAPALSNEYAQAFYEYWGALRGPGVAPMRSAIDPRAIPDLLPRLHGLRLRPDGSFLWRFMGDDLVDLYGRNPTGEVFNPGATPRHDRRFLSIYTAVSDRPCGAVLHSRAGARALSVAIETLVLPLLDDAGRTTELLMHSEPLDLDRLELRHFHQVSDLRIEGLDLFDIGAGKPPSQGTWALAGLKSCRGAQG